MCAFAMVGVEVFQLTCPSLHHSSLYIFAYVSFIKQLCTLLFLIVFPCLVVLFTPPNTTAQPHDLYSYHLFLSRTPVKQARYSEFSHAAAAGERSAEQQGYSSEEMKEASPSPDQRSQKPPSSESSFTNPADNEPIVPSDDDQRDGEKKDEYMFSNNNNHAFTIV